MNIYKNMNILCVYTSNLKTFYKKYFEIIEIISEIYQTHIDYIRNISDSYRLYQKYIDHIRLISYTYQTHIRNISDS